MKAKHYPNLHKLDWTPNWVFRKNSSQRRKEFVGSTGILATPKNEAAAYKKGLELFNDWLGVYLPQGRPLLIKDIARAVLAGTQGKRKTTIASKSDQILNHVIPGFGHLRPEQMTPLKWQLYVQDERRKGKRTKLANTRKALVEILHRAKAEGALRDVPRLKNYDPPAAPPRFISPGEWWAIRRKLSPAIRLLGFLMYYQGPRPSEALRYRFDMIKWNEGPTGMIEIPASITKNNRPRKIDLHPRVRSAFERMYREATSDWIFPSPQNPSKHMVSWNKTWDRAMEKTGLDYTIYNLRDTWVTNRLREALNSTFIGKYIDSSGAMIEKRYAVGEIEIMRRVAGIVGSS